MKDTRVLQRYYNEHVRFPVQFFNDPERFIDTLGRSKRGILSIYNHVDPEFFKEKNSMKYGGHDFKVLSLHADDRTGYIIIPPAEKDEAICRMIGVAIRKDGTNPIIRMIENVENGLLGMCAWTADNLHVRFSGDMQTEAEAIERLRTELLNGQEFTAARFNCSFYKKNSTSLSKAG